MKLIWKKINIIQSHNKDSVDFNQEVVQYAWWENY